MNEFKGPDVKAPRFRQKTVNIIDDNFFKNFKEKYPKYKNITKTELHKIMKIYNQTVWKEVIETRDGVQLPEGLGSLFIATCKPSKKQNIDYGKSKKYGVKVSNNNWATDGKLAKIFYTSYYTSFKFRNRECWGFIACREFKRTLAKNYPENWNIYVTVEPFKKLREQHKKQMYSERKKLESLNNYNEFDL